MVYVKVMRSNTTEVSVDQLTYGEVFGANETLHLSVQNICLTCDLSKTICGILTYQGHNVLSEVRHVFSHGEAQMTKRICIVPD